MFDQVNRGFLGFAKDVNTSSILAVISLKFFQYHQYFSNDQRATAWSLFLVLTNSATNKIQNISISEPPKTFIDKFNFTGLQSAEKINFNIFVMKRYSMLYNAAPRRQL